jgi:aspartyl-tRNA(Asn)/glutamyl-tRNA(Gln) amidotransferase subunit A
MRETKEKNMKPVAVQSAMGSCKLPGFDDIRRTAARDATHFPTMLKDLVAKIKSKKKLNAFIRLYEQEARTRSEAIAQKLADGKGGSLAGMTVGLKDLFSYANHPLQAASAILDGYVAQYDATAVARLLAHDALILGHQNCDEFGMGSANIHSVYGPTHHALDPTLATGGSSGGSAVAVQARLCHVALGTDTGGSVRQPAALCGVVGFKPTYGRISRYGVVAYASSFDTVGILAQNITDCARVLTAIAGGDGMDNTASSLAVPDYVAALKKPEGKMRIAYFPETLEDEGLQAEIKEATHARLQRLRQAGHTVEAVSFPLLHHALPTYYILSTAEASSNLARYDGIRYGGHTEEAANLKELYVRTRSEGFGKEVQRRMMLGAFVLSSGYYDAYYIRAQQVRRLIKTSLEQILDQYDFIVLPTTPTTAFSHEEAQQMSPVKSYSADLYTVPASVAGLPAISIPNGSDAKGLPIGLQLIGAPYGEAALLRGAQEILEL